MKKLSVVTCLSALLLIFLFAFSTNNPRKADAKNQFSTPLTCAPLASNAVNAIPFSLDRYSPQSVMVRKNIYSWNTTEIESLKKGILAMRALPVTDPTSWDYQAAIHGTTLTNNLQSWNSCQHGTRFFFSWHRMYLYFFERILRAKSGNPALTLPYWNYQTNPVIPPAFRDNTSGNPLYDATRFSSMNTGGSLPSSISSSINSALTYVLFYDYQTRLESPHGSVHTSIGGNMGRIATSGKDPIFYLHHANIDRLWEVWLWKCQGRSSPGSSDATWWNQKFTFFDETGRAIVMTGSQIVDIAAQLNYSYDTPPPYTTTTTTSSTSIPSPGRFEAESYIAKLGVAITSTTDDGGGRTVSSISTGDWMEYSVTIPAAASYRMNFRVANGTTKTRNLQVRNSSGSTLASVSIPKTGSSNTYTTISTTVTLPEGTQRIRIYSGSGGWLFNWFEIMSTSSTTTTTTTPCGTGRFKVYASMDWKSYELLKLQKVTRVNQKQVPLSLADANIEGLRSYVSKTNNSPLKLSPGAEDDKLYADIELLKLNKVPEGTVEIYLNLPAGAAPSSGSIYFADVLNLFGAAEHIHHNEKRENTLSVDLTAAAAEQGLTLADLSKAKLTFYVRGNHLPNGQELKTSFDAQLGTIKVRMKKMVK